MAGTKTGIVHQDIDAAKPLAHSHLEAADVFDAADVCCHRHHAICASHRCGGERFGCLRQTRFIDIGDANAHAKLREFHRRREADASRPTGDDGNGFGGQAWMGHRDFSLQQLALWLVVLQSARRSRAAQMRSGLRVLCQGPRRSVASLGNFLASKRQEAGAWFRLYRISACSI
jgi:hypothetical protein